MPRCVNRNLACARLSVDISIHFPHHLRVLDRLSESNLILSLKRILKALYIALSSPTNTAVSFQQQISCAIIFFIDLIWKDYFVPSLISRMVWNQFIYQVFFALKNSAVGNLLLCPDIQHPCWETD